MNSLYNKIEQNGISINPFDNGKVSIRFNLFLTETKKYEYSILIDTVYNDADYLGDVFGYLHVLESPQQIPFIRLNRENSNNNFIYINSNIEVLKQTPSPDQQFSEYTNLTFRSNLNRLVQNGLGTQTPTSGPPYSYTNALSENTLYQFDWTINRWKKINLDIRDHNWLIRKNFNNLDTFKENSVIIYNNGWIVKSPILGSRYVGPDEKGILRVFEYNTSWNITFEDINQRGIEFQFDENLLLDLGVSEFNKIPFFEDLRNDTINLLDYKTIIETSKKYIVREDAPIIRNTPIPPSIPRRPTLVSPNIIEPPRR